MNVVWLIGGADWVPWRPGSSYYQQTNLFASHLEEYGYTSTIIPVGSMEREHDSLVEAVHASSPDILVNFGAEFFLGFAEHVNVPMLAWYYYGGGELPEGLRMVPMTTFATISRYSQRALEAAGIPALYAPHAYDPNVFHPGDGARERLGLDHEGPIVAMVATNHESNGRDGKNWVGGLEAFAGFLESRPDALLYAHTNVPGLVDIRGVAEGLGIGASVVLSHATATPEHMADVYRAADVLLHPSLAESFGLPILEAQACGIPVVATDGSAMTEIVLTGTSVASDPILSGDMPRRDALVEGLIEWVGKPADPGLVAGYGIEAVLGDYFVPALEKGLTSR